MRTVIALALSVAPLPAQAQAPPGGCTISVSGLDFGIYSNLDPRPDTSLGRLSVRCVPLPGTAPLPRITISSGNSGQHLDRVMSSGSAELHYNLYAEPTRRLILGDGSAGTVAFPAPRTRALGLGNWPIFGAIVPGQRVPAGIYTDTLLIEVEF